MNKTSKLKRRCYTCPIVTGMKLALLFTTMAILFFTTDSISQTAETQVHKGAANSEPAAYEIPSTLSAYKILPSELLESKYHRVFDEVPTYGFTNRFTISSPFGQFEAYGIDMLKIRVNEIYALARLSEMKKTKTFGDAAKKASLSPIKGAWGLVSNPVDTVSGLPKGMWRFMSRVGKVVTGERSDVEDSKAKELIGFSPIKRKYAFKLGVDVYTSNKVLQKELNSVCWAAFAGGAGVKLLTIPLQGTAGIIVKGSSLVHKSNKILLDYAPEEIGELNRKLLEKIGVEDWAINLFLRNSYFSPRHQTIIVQSLMEMKTTKNRGNLIKQAINAECEEDAFLFQRIAEMLHGFNNYVKPISEMVYVRKIVAGYAADQTMVVVIPADRVYWTERVDIGSDAVKRLDFGDLPIRRTELWVTGGLTPVARQQLETKGIIIKEQIGDWLDTK